MNYSECNAGHTQNGGDGEYISPVVVVVGPGGGGLLRTRRAYEMQWSKLLYRCAQRERRGEREREREIPRTEQSVK